MTTTHHGGKESTTVDQAQGQVQAFDDVEVVVSPFAGFGRLAHLRRQLLAVPGVRTARIAGYGPGEARFRVGLAPTASLDDLRIPGTRISHKSSTLVALSVITG
jgi:hypothetical protein